MKRVGLMLLLLPLFAGESSGSLSPAQVRQLLNQAVQHYQSDEKPEPAEAAQLFRAAVENADPGEVHTDAVRLAEAMAWMQAGDPERALEAFEQIQGFEQPAHRARHRHLRGTAHLAAGEQAFAREDFGPAREHMESAVQSFIESLQEDPASDVGKRNLEIAHRRLQHIIDHTPPPPPPDESGEGQNDDTDPSEDAQDSPQHPPDSADPNDSEPPDNSDASDAPDTSDESDTSEESEESDPAGAPDASAPSEARESASSPDLEEDFSEEEAQRTLDALLEQERRLRDEILRNRNRQLQTLPVEKDW